MKRLLVLTLLLIAGCDGPATPAAPEVPVPVEVPLPTSLTVNPTSIELTEEGATHTITAEVRDQHGEVMTVTVSWRSSDSTVVTVSSDGVVTAVANGAATITASFGAVSANARITVAIPPPPPPPPEPTTLTINPATLTFTEEGATETLTAEVRDQYDQVMVVTVTWESSAESVATVSTEGVVTAIANGAATIVASADGISASAEVTVDVPPPPPGYPIHLTFMGDVHEDLREGMQKAVDTWSQILAPTKAAPFVVTHLDPGYTLSLEGATVRFVAGDILEPGLHIYVYARNNSRWERPIGRGEVAGLSGETDVEMKNSVGVIMLNDAYFRGQFEYTNPVDHETTYYGAIYEVSLHEIGHVLGIGTGRRWQDRLRRDNKGFLYLDDPVSIAVFDKMGGTNFPSSKAPVAFDRAHWDYCAGVPDMMSDVDTRSFKQITELTVASLDYGYEYDPSLVVTDAEIYPNLWSLGPCENGRYAGSR